MRKIAPRLNMKLVDIEGATCCPIPEIVRLADHDAWLNISARNLALAEVVSKDVMVVCNGCWETLHDTQEAFADNPDLITEVNSRLSLIDKTFSGKVKVKHFLEVVMEDIGLDKLKKAVKKPLTQLKVAIQYGCKLYKSENEKLVSYFDDIIQAIGVKKVDFDAEKVCCGFPFSLYSLDAALEERSKWKLDKIKAAKVDCIVTTCPGCYDVLEKAQLLLKRQRLSYEIPMLHLIELIALALGFQPQEIGLDKHRIKTDAVVKKISRNGG